MNKRQPYFEPPVLRELLELKQSLQQSGEQIDILGRAVLDQMRHNQIVLARIAAAVERMAPPPPQHYAASEAGILDESTTQSKGE